MAKNLIFEEEILYVTCTHPTSPKSGQPVRVGGLTGVAVEDENTDGKTTVDFRTNVYDLKVKGVDDSGNSAVAVGDDLFYVDGDIDDGTGFLSKKVSGRYFGVANEPVNSAATATIQVLKYAGPGTGTLDIGQVITAAELADSAVTAAKLATDAVETAKIKDANVTAAKLATDAVETAKIKDANVTAAKLATDAVETAKIKDLNVTAGKLAADAVETAKIKDLNVTTGKLAAAGVTFAKAAVFVSTEQTGTGNPQNVAHGLGAVPAAVLVVPTEHPGTPDTGAFDIAEGSHDGTNVVVTVTLNVKFKVMAWA